MRKEAIICLFLLVFITGCAEEKSGPKEEIINEEQVADNSKIITKEGTYKGKEYQREDISYEKDGKEFQNYFDSKLREALDWIKENTEEGVFLSWWDYGHMIRGYTDNDVIIFSPSEDIMWSIASGKWDEEKSGRFSSKEKINDVVEAFTTHDVEKTIGIMEKYNADHVLVTKQDADKGFVLFKIAGLEDYLDENHKPTNKALSTILFRMINKEGVEGLSLVYSDDVVRIYKTAGS